MAGHANFARQSAKSSAKVRCFQYVANDCVFNIFLAFLFAGRQHDSHQFAFVREMTVAVMFPGQLLSEKNTDYVNWSKYVMFSTSICAHAPETILCVVFGGTCHSGKCTEFEQTWLYHIFWKTAGGRVLAVYTKFWHI